VPGCGCDVQQQIDVEGPVREKLLELEKQWNEFLKKIFASRAATATFVHRSRYDQLVWAQLMGIVLPLKSTTGVDRFMRNRDGKHAGKKGFSRID